MKICVIGCGNHAVGVHGPSYRRYAEWNQGTELAACCDVDAGAAERFARDYGFRCAYTDYQEMLERESPDAVGIVLPVHLTREITEQALLTGCACIVEKPPALDAEGVARLADAEARSGSPLRVAFNRRFMPVIRALRERLTERGEPVRHIHYEMHRVGRFNEDFSTTAIHGLDLVGFLGDAYEGARITYQDVGTAGRTGVNFLLDCTMRGGATARLSFLPAVGRNAESVAAHTDSRTYIAQLPWNSLEFGGLLSVYAEDRLLTQITPADMGEGPEPYETCGFYYEIASFLDELRDNGINTQGRIETTLQPVELAHAIRNRAGALVWG